MRRLNLEIVKGECLEGMMNALTIQPSRFDEIKENQARNLKLERIKEKISQAKETEVKIHDDGSFRIAALGLLLAASLLLNNHILSVLNVQTYIDLQVYHRLQAPSPSFTCTAKKFCHFSMEMQVSSPANLFSLAVCVTLTLSRYRSLLSNVITHVTSLRLQTLFDHLGGFCIFYFAIFGLVEGKVIGVKSNISQVGFDIDSIREMINGLVAI
ncbi:uncharacterized protein [Spinacia oleracea]|uniref:Uncharacterized protein n=1 Tax=Spinacia oleracea TaxID=3562 RepID=A0ABM3QZF9_SPIOL|nr:uncharacterized protein LOC110787045 [Spinacia oleracea]